MIIKCKIMLLTASLLSSSAHFATTIDIIEYRDNGEKTGNAVMIQKAVNECNSDRSIKEYSYKRIGNTADAQPIDLQCEYLKNPLGIDVIKPRLSWKMGTASTKRGQKQTAYQILVASSRMLLDKDHGDLWDSGRIKSDESVQIFYNGKSLKAGQKCFWKVRLADEQGHWTLWSETAYWQMGLFADDWKARWIGSPEMESLSVGGKKIDNKMPDPWFRKTFTLTEKPQEALVYVASIGYHELYVNGQKIGDAVLAPSVTDHITRARYNTYDVGKYVKAGENVLALWLGTSWSIFPAYQREDKPSIPMA